jgi:hypothetical protein
MADTEFGKDAQKSNDTLRIQVLDAIREVGGSPFTLSDLVARSGLPPHVVEGLLNTLVREYRSDLDVDAQGRLIYRFDPSLSAREDIVSADAARRRKAAFRDGLIAFFKAWTVAMVIVYFIIYVILLIAFIVAMSKASDDRRRSSSSSMWGRGIHWWFGWGSPWGSGGYGTYTSRRRRREWNVETERQLREGRDPYRLDTQAAPKKPGLAERTWYHLFGAEGIKRNPLAQEKELLTYLRAKRGFISNADIVALLGVSYAEADSIGTRLVATYEGEMDLTDDGVAIYRFPNLMVTGAPAVAAEAAQLGYLWQVRQKEDALRRYPARVIPILNIVNIMLGCFSAFVILPTFGWTSAGVYVALVAFPMLFSAIFLGLGIRRKLREISGRVAYERDSMRLAIYQLLFSRRTAVKLPGDERALASVGLGEFDASKLRALAPSLAELIEAEVTEVGGRLEVRAPRIWREIAAVERLRAKAKSTEPVGRTVFTTRDVEGASPIGEVGPSERDRKLADDIASLERELQR